MEKKQSVSGELTQRIRLLNQTHPDYRSYPIASFINHFKGSGSQAQMKEEQVWDAEGNISKLFHPTLNIHCNPE